MSAQSVEEQQKLRYGDPWQATVIAGSRDGGIVPVEPKACPSAASARLAQTHVGVIAWSRTGDPDLGDWGPPEVLVRTGVIPDEFEAGGDVE